MTERDRVEYLLETYNEAREVMGHTNDTRGTGGDHVPLMSELWNTGSYRTLETLMRDRMRHERPKQYRHVTWRYLEAEDRAIEVRVYRIGNDYIPKLPPHTIARGKPAYAAGNTARIAVRIYRPEVRLQQVRLGVDWLTTEIAKQGGAWLPTLLTAA